MCIIRTLNTSLIFLWEAVHYFILLHNPSFIYLDLFKNLFTASAPQASFQDNTDFCWLLWMPQWENKLKPQKILLHWKNKRENGTISERKPLWKGNAAQRLVIFRQSGQTTLFLHLAHRVITPPDLSNSPFPSEQNRGGVYKACKPEHLVSRKHLTVGFHVLSDSHSAAAMKTTKKCNAATLTRSWNEHVSRAYLWE